MRRLRFLHIITRLDRGDSAENTLLTAVGMDPERFDVTIAVGPTEGEPGPTEIEARDRGVRFVHLDCLVRTPNPWIDLRALVALRGLLREEPWDLVHTHTSKAGILGRWIAHQERVPAIVHTPPGHVFYGYYGSVVTALFRTLEWLAAGWCHRLVVLTAADRDEHLHFGVEDASQWVVVHSGVDFRPLDQADTDRETVRAGLGVAPKDLLVLTLGRLAAVKGQGDLIRAFAEFLPAHPKAWLVLVGDVLRAADIFALPSHNEGMGKALVEAMYLGCPVVTTNVGGIPELVRDGEQGLLIPPRSPSILADALQRLADDENLRRRLGQSARRRACDYGSASMVEKLTSLYEELVPSAQARLDIVAN
jgi:glycosyltransferase involved in cell wall biosynthesis